MVPMDSMLEALSPDEQAQHPVADSEPNLVIDTDVSDEQAAVSVFSYDPWPHSQAQEILQATEAIGTRDNSTQTADGPFDDGERAIMKNIHIGISDVEKIPSSNTVLENSSTAHDIKELADVQEPDMHAPPLPLEKSQSQESMDIVLEEEEQAEEDASQEAVYLPLLDFLCAYMHCSLKELQVLFNNLESRRRMLSQLRTLPNIRTTHLRPPERNISLHAHDLSAQNANQAFACGGYLDITVRQYYYIKHGRKLKHPYLPCLIEFGGGEHASYYPLEMLAVEITQKRDTQFDAMHKTIIRLLTKNENCACN